MVTGGLEVTDAATTGSRWRTVESRAPLPPRARNAALASSRLSATPPLGLYDGSRELRRRVGIIEVPAVPRR